MQNFPSWLLQGRLPAFPVGKESRSERLEVNRKHSSVTEMELILPRGYVPSAEFMNLVVTDIPGES